MAILEILPLSKVKGMHKGSILIISYGCEIHPECQRYCDLHEIRILRMD
ncbi:hypothetical protein [Clostridium sp. C2-6-12]|nr:hypothetical protein [Clostridium sp. C2-6-12]